MWTYGAASNNIPAQVIHIHCEVLIQIDILYFGKLDISLVKVLL